MQSPIRIRAPPPGLPALPDRKRTERFRPDCMAPAAVEETDRAVSEASLKLPRRSSLYGGAASYLRETIFCFLNPFQSVVLFHLCRSRARRACVLPASDVPTCT